MRIWKTKELNVGRKAELVRRNTQPEKTRRRN